MEYPSLLIERAVEAISKFPGIGKKTALRLVLHMLKQPENFTSDLSLALRDLRENIKYCTICHIIADTEDCTCRNAYRDTSAICVVEDTPDVLAIRSTGQYNGLFHVLGGRISPVDGIGPENVNIGSLINRVKSDDQVKEIILALSTTMEGDTTSFYITRLLKEENVKVTTIARGIPVGSELEFADEVTLGRSIATRTIFNQD
ncbi:MAG: recombination protein RecR [Ekhidna sp.]|nr:recombination protein RecR [Ekhidna sp.]MBC6410733.1 recombination protein RecR [Ekhidna sp.]MBC6425899.1 recombination protein RecR [Ekhidna sp.]